MIMSNFRQFSRTILESYVVLISNILELTNNLNDYIRKRQQQTHNKIIIDDEELNIPQQRIIEIYY